MRLDFSLNTHLVLEYRHHTKVFKYVKRRRTADMDVDFVGSVLEYPK